MDKHGLGLFLLMGASYFFGYILGHNRGAEEVGEELTKKLSEILKEEGFYDDDNS